MGWFASCHGHILSKVDVKARRLDDIVNKLGLKRVNCVKIDAEGSELHVLGDY